MNGASRPDIIYSAHAEKNRTANDLQKEKKYFKLSLNNQNGTNSQIGCAFNELTTGTPTARNENSFNMSELLEIVQQQSAQLAHIREDVKDMQKLLQINMDSQKDTYEIFDDFQKNLLEMVEDYMLKGVHNAFQSSFNNLNICNISPNYLSALNELFEKQTNVILNEVVTTELQKTFTPFVLTKFDELKKSLDAELMESIQKLNINLENLVLKVFTQKTVVNVFSDVINTIMTDKVKNVFIESMQHNLIPAFEEISRLVFAQLKDLYISGTNDMLENLYSHHLESQQSFTIEFSKNLHAFFENMSTTLSKFKTDYSNIISESQYDIKNMESQLLENLTTTLKEEVNKSAKSLCLRGSIMELISSEQTGEAIHRALLSNDINSLEYVLANIEPNDIFMPICKLSQEMLLGLIEKLSEDMSAHNEIRQKYLTEAIIAVDQENPIVMEQSSKLLLKTYHNCKEFLKNYSKNSQCSNVRMLVKVMQTIFKYD